MGGGIKIIIRKNKKFSLKMLKSILVINTTIVWIKYRFDIDNVRTLPNVILSNIKNWQIRDRRELSFKPKGGPNKELKFPII